MRILAEMHGTDLIGWAASAILVLTIAKQVWKQWASGTSEGVSKWLFLGQIAASAGFTVYSWLIHSFVFVVTNLLTLVSGIAGLAIVRLHRRRERGVERPVRMPRAVRAGP